MHGLGITLSWHPKRTLRVACAFSLAVTCTLGVHAAAASAVTITEFSSGLNSGSYPVDIAAGAHGTMWFTDDGSVPAIGKITPSGAITEYSTGLNPGSMPYNITAGHDGTMWFTDDGSVPAIGKITPSGAITEYSTGLNSGSMPYWITLGGNGDIWFTDIAEEAGSGPAAIGKITPSGTITEYTAGFTYCGGLGGPQSPGPEFIVPAAGGQNLWFNDPGSPAIGKVTASGAITEYCLPAEVEDSPTAITSGLNGDAWFTTNEAIGKITPSGTITRYSHGLTPGSEPFYIALGADGNVWFTGVGERQSVGKISPSGTIHEYSLGLSPGSLLAWIAPGPRGMWFADWGQTPAIGLITPSGAIHEFATTGMHSQPGSIAGGAGDLAWFLPYGAIGRVQVH
jgi:streptogramin lyase